MAENEKKTGKHKGIIAFLKWLCVFALMVVFLRYASQYVIARTVVDGNSMYPTLHDRDNLMIFNLQRSFDRFDIVVFNSSINGDEYLIKI